MSCYILYITYFIIVSMLVLFPNYSTRNILTLFSLGVLTGRDVAALPSGVLTADLGGVAGAFIVLLLSFDI